MNLKDNPGDSIKKTGPNIDEEAVIKAMWENGEKREEYARAFPDILPSALDLYLASLDKRKAERDAKLKADAEAQKKAEADAAAAAKAELDARDAKKPGKPDPLK